MTKRRAPRIRIPVGILSAVVALGVLVSGAAGAAAGSAPRYFGVIDAGSSGSRVGLYELRGTGPRLTATVVHFYNPNDDGGPGIEGLSSFVATPERAGPDGIAPLLTDLDGVLAQRGIAKADVPMTVLATAGMRNVERDDPAAVGPIYASVRSAVEAAGYPIAEVGTMPGRDEALYTWVAVNSLTGALRRGTRTTGIAQVAFETPDAGKGIGTRRVMGRRYRLFMVSYLGLGRNDARATMIPADASTVGSPCWPNNAAGVAPATYALGNKVAVAANPSSYDLPTCTDVAITAIDATVARSENAGLVRPTAIRRLSGFSATRFVGIDKLTEVYEEFGVGFGRTVGGRLHDAIDASCSGPDAWPRVLALHAGEDSSTSENGCANATFVHTWLFSPDALGLRARQIDPEFEIDGTTLTWTLGYAIVAGS